MASIVRGREEVKDPELLVSIWLTRNRTLPWLITSEEERKHIMFMHEYSLYYKYIEYTSVHDCMLQYTCAHVQYACSHTCIVLSKQTFISFYQPLQLVYCFKSILCRRYVNQSCTCCFFQHEIPFRGILTVQRWTGTHPVRYITTSSAFK